MNPFKESVRKEGREEASEGAKKIKSIKTVVRRLLRGPRFRLGPCSNNNKNLI